MAGTTIVAAVLKFVREPMDFASDYARHGIDPAAVVLTAAQSESGDRCSANARIGTSEYHAAFYYSADEYSLSAFECINSSEGWQSLTATEYGDGDEETLPNGDESVLANGKTEEGGLVRDLTQDDLRAFLFDVATATHCI